MIQIVASIVIGATMCAAGASKIAMGKKWPAEAASMGAPRVIVPILPWIEIALGALLLVQWERRLVAFAAALLLSAFSISIAVNLARGRRPVCACFGSWSSRPLGWRHVLRNAILIAIAVVAGL